MQAKSAFVTCAPSAAGIKWQVHMQRLMCPLRTGLARTDVTIDADLAVKPGPVHVVRLCIADSVGMSVFTADGHDKPSILRLTAEHRPISSAADREEPGAVRQFHKLRKDQTRHPKRTMQIPDRTGAAIFGKGEFGRVEPLGDIPGPVHA